MGLFRRTPDPRRLHALGNEHRQAGRLADAIRAYRDALRMAPDSVASLYNLGTCLADTGAREEALGCFRRVAELEPGDAPARFHLGRLSIEAGAHEAALKPLERATSIEPRNALFRLYLGMAQAGADRVEAAAASFRAALELEPGYADAHYNLGNALRMLSRPAEALAQYRAALECRPQEALFELAVLEEMQHLCDWSRPGELEAAQRRALREGTAIDPFSVLSTGTTRAEQLAFARLHAARFSSQPVERRSLDRQRDRITVGYLSADFHEHATAYLMAELFELHDKSRFAIHAYSYGPDDRSAMRERLHDAFERFVDLRPLSDRVAAEAIAADGVDILVDLKGYTRGARTGIVAARPAPVQVSFVGYPGTMGASFIDYLVADAFIAPPGCDHDYSEKLVRLPDSYQPNDRRRPHPSTVPRASLGLPDEALVFCCFNQAYKITEPVFSAWMRLLAGAPGSVLWLLESAPETSANLRRAAEVRGIDPSRLAFAAKAPLEAHLARIGAADLFLDSFPYTAHTTASDALWAGVPVITCAGDTFASRVAGSLLRAQGLDGLVTASLEDYEALAVRIAATPPLLATLRQRVSNARDSGRLFDAPRFTHHLEAAYERMWGLHASGQAPKAIAIDAGHSAAA
jgi:predicted O-linked N-acetylglucosamine transferase (SPINDLY family)